MCLKNGTNGENDSIKLCGSASGLFDALVGCKKAFYQTISLCGIINGILEDATTLDERTTSRLKNIVSELERQLNDGDDQIFFCTGMNL